MLKAKDMKAIVEWQKKGTRGVKIEIGGYSSSLREFKIWFYDHTLETGEHVFLNDSLNIKGKFYIPDLAKKKETEDKAKLKELNEIYGGKNG
jgi:hypothetical protein